MDIFGTFESYRGDAAAVLLTALGFSARRLYLKVLRKTAFGQMWALWLIGKRLQKRIRERARDLNENDTTPYGVENLFGLDEIRSLFPWRVFPWQRKGRETTEVNTDNVKEYTSKIANDVQEYTCKIVKDDKDWDRLAQTLRARVNNQKTADDAKLDKALRDFFKDACVEVLRVAGRNADDTHKIEGLLQLLEKSKYDDWLPELSSRLRPSDLILLESICKELKISFKDHFEDANKRIYDNIRGEIWWDQLLVSAKALMLYDYLRDPSVFAVSLFLQHAPILSKGFSGLDSYYSNITFQKFKDDITRYIPSENGTPEFQKKVWRVCTAAWNRSFFKELIKEKQVDLALTASLIRVVNLATTYSAREDLRKRLQNRLDKILKEDWSTVPKDLYSLCVAAVAKRVVKVDKAGRKKAIEIIRFSDIPSDFAYLVPAFKGLIESEITFISECVRKAPAAKETFDAFLKDFDEIYVNRDPVEKHKESRWVGIPSPAILAESALQVLAHIDVSTASSSEIAERFAKGIIAVLEGATADGEEDKMILRRLIAVARGLRPQLGRVQQLVKMIEVKLKCDFKPVVLSGEIKSYLSNVTEMRRGAVKNAVEELQNLKKPGEGPIVFFVFGYGGPLWETLKQLCQKTEVLVVTAPLRPVGEGEDVRIVRKFDEDISGNAGRKHRAVLVSDELIGNVMREGVSLAGGKKVPDFWVPQQNLWVKKGSGKSPTA